jgi:Asparagine synthase
VTDPADLAPAVGTPRVCGALGDYDRQRVAAIAAGFEAPLRRAHEDERSILMLDREPLRWRGRRQRGLGWIEGGRWRDGAAEWQGAARAGACGLVVEGRRRLVHSAVNGIAPVYWIDDGGATYFASRIDPLVRACPGRLSIDWDAWAATIVLRFPLGGRTPFAEIGRLPPFATLRRRLGRTRVDVPRWPWSEVEPRLSPAQGAEAVVAGLRESLAPLDRAALCPLSGGRDSRIVACALAEAGRASLALTTGDDEGDDYEEALAAPVAARLGIPHERIGSQAADYPWDWEERAARVEHQFVDHAWLVPVARRVADSAQPVGDGFAIDALFAAGGLFYLPATLDRRDPRGASLALFDSMRQFGAAQRALVAPFHEPLVARARELFLEVAKPFEGHPSQAVLSFYSSRSVRGISTYPSGLLGRQAEVLTPGAADAVAIGTLAVQVSDKQGGRLYEAVFERLAPQVGLLPSTKDTPRRPPRLPRRWRSEPALDHHRELLADGPLAAHVSPDLRAWLDAPRGVELPGDLRLGMESISLFHSWLRRYGDRLRPVDAGDLLG